ncbi:RTC4-like domain-containing protein [Aspergillus crustosus]
MVSLRARQDHSLTDRKPKFEPDVDDSPVSSDAEEESQAIIDSDDEIDSTPRKRSRPSGGLTFEERLAQATSVSKSSQDSNNGKGKRKWSEEKDFKSPSSSRKRGSKEILNDMGGFSRDLFSGIRSSQQSYKRRSMGYGSKFRKTPSSSMAESYPPSSAPHPKSSSTEVSVKTDSPETEETGFKFPKDFDTALSYDGLEISDSEADTDDDSDLSELTQDSKGEIVRKPDPVSVGSGRGGGEVTKTEYLCPMCKEPVDPLLLLRFQNQPKQRFRDQNAFCKSHKLSSAEKQWEDKNYPKIDWLKLDKRIEAHLNDLEKFLVPESSSYYRNVLDTILKKGKAKNFRLDMFSETLEISACGYYGSRGSSKMLETVTSRFSRKLRRLAVDDKIVKQAGPVGYAQNVLVPELCVILVKEDMNVDDDTARQIMRESSFVGEILNPAPNDRVPINAKETNSDSEG